MTDTPAAVDPFQDEAPAEILPVREGEDLDWPTIETYLREHLAEHFSTDGAFEVLQFPNGAANLTYLLRIGDTELVLRRPPFGALAPGAHDMKREHKVLSRLWRHFDRAPRAYLFCDDHSVAGADFFVMERRRGEVIRGVIPESMRGHENVGQRMGIALVDAMAEFHLLDPEACGLSDLGKPDGFVSRQLHGWKKRWDLVVDAAHDTAMKELYRGLSELEPTPPRVSFVHNDLKLDNSLFKPDDPDRVDAFFDWDMTTLGDPLVDLGTLLNYWPDPSDPEGARRGGHDGMTRMGLPARQQIIDRYGNRSGLDVSGARWYEAFGQWKTVVVVQQLHHRWQVGDSTDPRMEHIAKSIPSLIEQAEAALGSLSG